MIKENFIKEKRKNKLNSKRGTVNTVKKIEKIEKNVIKAFNIYLQKLKDLGVDFYKITLKKNYKKDIDVNVDNFMRTIFSKLRTVKFAYLNFEKRIDEITIAVMPFSDKDLSNELTEFLLIEFIKYYIEGWDVIIKRGEPLKKNKIKDLYYVTPVIDQFLLKHTLELFDIENNTQRFKNHNPDMCRVQLIDIKKNEYANLINILHIYMHTNNLYQRGDRIFVIKAGEKTLYVSKINVFIENNKADIINFFYENFKIHIVNSNVFFNFVNEFQQLNDILSKNDKLLPCLERFSDNEIKLIDGYYYLQQGIFRKGVKITAKYEVDVIFDDILKIWGSITQELKKNNHIYGMLRAFLLTNSVKLKDRIEIGIFSDIDFFFDVGLREKILLEKKEYFYEKRKKEPEKMLRIFADSSVIDIVFDYLLYFFFSAILKTTEKLILISIISLREEIKNETKIER